MKKLSQMSRLEEPQSKVPMKRRMTMRSELMLLFFWRQDDVGLKTRKLVEVRVHGRMKFTSLSHLLAYLVSPPNLPKHTPFTRTMKGYDPKWVYSQRKEQGWGSEMMMEIKLQSAILPTVYSLWNANNLASTRGFFPSEVNNPRKKVSIYWH